MAETWRYRGQEIGSEQIVFLREFIRTHPNSSRWKLSRQLCEALGWKQANRAGVGDLFMSLIHTCELNGANPFDYLTELLRHAEELKRNPSEWMPWNYRETLARLATPAAAQYDGLSWPKRIVFGQACVTLQNGRQTGLSKGKIRQRCWPAVALQVREVNSGARWRGPAEATGSRSSTGERSVTSEP